MKKIINKSLEYTFQGTVLSLIVIFTIGMLLAFHGCGLPRNHVCGKKCVSTVLLDTVYITDKPQ